MRSIKQWHQPKNRQTEQQKRAKVFLGSLIGLPRTPSMTWGNALLFPFRSARFRNVLGPTCVSQYRLTVISKDCVCACAFVRMHLEPYAFLRHSWKGMLWKLSCIPLWTGLISIPPWDYLARKMHHFHWKKLRIEQKAKYFSWMNQVAYKYPNQMSWQQR